MLSRALKAERCELPVLCDSQEAAEQTGGGFFHWPGVYIIDAHYRRHCHLQTLRGDRHCQVNVSLTSAGTESQDASGVFLCDE